MTFCWATTSRLETGLVRSSKHTVRESALAVLCKVARNNGYVDKLLEKDHELSNFTAVDRALLVELVSGTVRWRGYLDWVITQLLHGDLGRTPLQLKSILQLSLYQIIYLDRIPDYAVVSEAVSIAKKLGGEKWGKLVNGLLRAYLRKGSSLVLPELEANPAFSLSITYSHPQWLIERWIAQYGIDNTRAYCEYNNRRPGVTLRINLNCCTREDVLAELSNAGISVAPSKFFGDFITIKNKSAAVFKHRLFKEGVVTVQDESTAMAALLVAPKAGETVLDMCAAPGGKTCHLSHLMADNGKVISVDINRKRLMLIKENTQRLGLKSVEIMQQDASCLNISPVEKILLDAPCSGLGVLSKRTDLRWRRTPEDITQIRKLQLKLLQQAAKLIKPDGVIVYSTCTLEPEETTSVVQEFICSHNNFKIDSGLNHCPRAFNTPDGYWRTLPFEHAIDGSFAVRLLKTA